MNWVEFSLRKCVFQPRLSCAEHEKKSMTQYGLNIYGNGSFSFDLKRTADNYSTERAFLNVRYGWEVKKRKEKLKMASEGIRWHTTTVWANRRGGWETQTRKKGKIWHVNHGGQPEDGLCVSVGEAVGGRRARRLGGRHEGPGVTDSPPGPPSGPTLGIANPPWHA